MGRDTVQRGMCGVSAGVGGLFASIYAVSLFGVWGGWGGGEGVQGETCSHMAAYTQQLPLGRCWVQARMWVLLAMAASLQLLEQGGLMVVAVSVCCGASCAAASGMGCTRSAFCLSRSTV
jgi:hypothetical protein